MSKIIITGTTIAAVQAIQAASEQINQAIKEVPGNMQDALIREIKEVFERDGKDYEARTWHVDGEKGISFDSADFRPQPSGKPVVKHMTPLQIAQALVKVWEEGLVDKHEQRMDYLNQARFWYELALKYQGELLA